MIRSIRIIRIIFMTQTDFLREYIVTLLDESGIATSFTQEQKDRCTEELISIIQERIGLEFVPKLSDVDLKTFTSMVQNGKTNPKEWKQFWQKAIPSFEEDLKVLLVAFAQELKTLLA